MNEADRIPITRNARAPLPPEWKGSLVLGVMSEFNRDQLGFITKLRSLGDVVRARFLYVPAYFVYHPDDIEYLLVTNAKNFRKAMSLRSKFFYRLVGNGLLTSEGDFWRRQRRLAQPAFHKQRISNYGDVMVEYTERMLAGWKAGETRDVHRDMTRLTLEIVVKTLFDANVSSDADNIGRVLSEIVKPFASQATLKWILDNRLPTPGHRQFNRSVGEIDEIIYRIIADRRRSEHDKGDLLSMLLQAQDEDGSQMSDAQLRDEVITLFLAGHETTALALSWTWYLLATHKDAESKFCDEIDRVLDGRLPTLNDLQQLRYTEMIAKETMRLYPPAFGLGREAIEECEIGGFRVPRKAQIFTFQWATQRDPRFFDQPDEFIPDRWTPEFTEQLPKFAYFPFGGGPRFCIGNSFAMMEMILLMATIGRRFKFDLASDAKVELYPAMSLRPKSGVRVVVTER